MDLTNETYVISLRTKTVSERRKPGLRHTA